MSNKNETRGSSTVTTKSSSVIASKEIKKGSTTIGSDEQIAAAVQEYLTQYASKVTPVVCHANTDAVYQNVLCSTQELTTPEIAARIHEELPTIDMKKIIDAPRLAEALNYSAHMAEEQPADPTKSDLKLGKGYRRKLLSTIRTGVEWGVIPQAKVDELHKGPAKADIAHVLINGVELMRSYEEQFQAKKLTLASHEFLADAEKLGRRILTNTGAGAPLVAKLQQEKDARILARDILYALMIQRYNMMRRVGFWMWEDDVSLHMPALCAAAKRAKPANDNATQPATNAAPATPATAPTSAAAPVATVTKISA
jgi:hypothetical protein